ncbi:hypothetical protein PI126_g21096 [Phytophthora idaei]|nr:hypothetical protein PI126_g21096 [Phytophthora idaei]
MQRDCSYARACAGNLQKTAKRKRSEEQTRKSNELSERLKPGYEAGDAVWLYITQVQPGLSRKLPHLGPGPFRTLEIHDDYRGKLMAENTGYRVNPWLHISKLKPRSLFRMPPREEAAVPEDDDFDAALRPEDCSEPDHQDDYEVEAILDLRWTKRTRTSLCARKYLVKWKGYDETE